MFLAGLPGYAGPRDAEAVIGAAIADPARPAADREQDANRKPLQVLSFAGIKPGDKVADFIPGGGYMTRLFSKIVGPSGRVYAVVPEENLEKWKADKAVKDIAADPAYPNVSVLHAPVNKFPAPEPLDLVWTSMNYHDLHLEFFGPADLAAVNKAVFAALKPGGIYLVLDHAAAAGSGLRDAGTLHRIDPEVVKREVLAAGFVLEAESDALKNPSDDHSRKVFDDAVRGKTDKFIFRFRKPEH
jgi:predicted methyltransferase